MFDLKPYKNKTTSETRMAVQTDWMNSLGIMHGGEVVKFIDEAAGIVTCETAKTHSCVTAAFHDVQFVAPTHLGDVIRSVATVVHWSYTTYTVEVFLYRQGILNGSTVESLCAHAWVTMVAVDEEGKPTAVPSLDDTLTTDEGKRRYQLAEEMIAASKKRRHI